MTYNPMPEFHIPPLKPCPFCGREALATSHRATPSSVVQWSIGCWREADPFSREAHWEDCPGPTRLWISLVRAAAQWNRRVNK